MTENHDEKSPFLSLSLSQMRLVFVILIVIATTAAVVFGKNDDDNAVSHLKSMVLKVPMTIIDNAWPNGWQGERVVKWDSLSEFLDYGLVKTAPKDQILDHIVKSWCRGLLVTLSGTEYQPSLGVNQWTLLFHDPVDPLRRDCDRVGLFDFGDSWL